MRINPGVGFVGRRDLIVTSPAVWFDLRPSWRPSFLRSIGPGFTAFFYHEYTSRRFQEGAVTFRLPQLVFQSGASITPLMLVNWQNLTTEEASGFRPLGVPIPTDDYFYISYGVNLETDLSRKFALSAEFNAGDYLNGHLLTLDSFVQMAPNPKLALRLAYTLNEARRLGEDRMRATSHLLGPELRLALNPRVQLYAFYQYNTLVDQGAWNLRFGWEFRPLSYLYLVLNDSRFYIDDALRQANPNRFATQQQVILKVSYLMQL